MDIKSLLKQSYKQTNQFCYSLLSKLWYFIINILVLHKKKYLFTTFRIIVIVGFLQLGLLLGVLWFKLTDLSDIEGLDNYGLYEIPSIVYDINEKPIKIFAIHQREIISYEKIPKTVIDTLLSAEDREFFNHKGVNPFGIVRAMIMNILSGHVVQGGSTLSQQLAKLLFTNRERNIKRKIKELIYALQIEKKFTKEEILEKYLNKVYYGNGVYSIASASRFYFGIPLQKLNYAQAALLVSIPPNPTFYNPLTRPINVKNRQAVIMKELIKEGKISAEEAERQIAAVWDILQSNLLDGSYFNDRQKDFDLAPYFSEYIRRYLYEKYGEGLYTQGYKIYTSIDIDLQQAAQKTVQERLSAARKTYQDQAQVYYRIIRNRMRATNPGNPIITEFLGVALGIPKLHFYIGDLQEKIRLQMNKENLPALSLVFSAFGMNGMKRMMDNIIQNNQNAKLKIDEIQGALISTEASTGRILAMVGGYEFSSLSQINRTYQSRRQPGSTFKPLLYLSALNSGRFTAASQFVDKPIAFELPDGSVWAPGNSAQNYQAEITLRNALRRSVNIISVKLIQALGINQAIDFISNFLGLEKKRFRFDSSLALGTSELTPMELNKGYAVIANGGKEVKPHGLIMVKNRYNQVVLSPEDDLINGTPKQLVDPRYNYIITTMMQDVFKRGTATKTALNMNFPLENVAGKTGTASNMSDAWFSGFNSQVATTVWIGFDQRTSLGINAFGAVLAEPIWIDYMKEVIKKYPMTSFVKPSGIVSAIIHKDNGLLMPNNCLNSPQAMEEFFTPETLPTRYSDYCDKKMDVVIESSSQVLDNKDIFASSL